MTKRFLISFTFFMTVSSIIMEIMTTISLIRSMPKILTPSFIFAVTLTVSALITLVFSLYLSFKRKKERSKGTLKIEISILVNKLEKAYDVVANKSTLETTRDVSVDVNEVIHAASGNSRTALLLLSAKIEGQMILRLQEAESQPQTNYVLSRQNLDEATKQGLIPLELTSVFHDFVYLRNKIAYDASSEVDEDTTLSLLAIGIELLKIISVKSLPV